MGIDQSKPAYTDEAASFIKEEGGKMGGLAYLRSKGGALADAVLPAQIVKHDDEWHGATVEPGYKDKYILRASHPNDFQGLVDVIETHVVEKTADIGAVIDRMREQARSEAVVAYARSENPDYDGKITVGVQPYMTGIRGSVVEHPNAPGEYVISTVEKNRSSFGSGVDIETRAYSPAGRIHLALPGGRIEESEAAMIVDAYKMVERAKIVPEDLTFQMEFLHDYKSVTITQIRVFMRKQLASFALKERRRLVFGVTPPEGIELPVLQSPNGRDAYKKILTHSEPWAFLKTNHDAVLDLDFQARNMAAYLVSQSWSSGLTASLEHHHFRYAQKADITIFENYGLKNHDFSRLIFGEKNTELMKFSLANLELAAKFQNMERHEATRQFLLKNAGPLPVNARIISDGLTATVEPVIDL